MNQKSYNTPAALEMAVKAAARKSSQDTGKAIEAYYSGRLLERVFSEEVPRFVLKGGRSILARTTDARYTRDTDFLYKGLDLDEALEALKQLAAQDLGDFLEFRFVSAVKIAEDQEYRDGYRVVFTPVLGGTKSMNDISIDLVVDQVSSSEADVITPVNRLHIEGLQVFDYHVYSVVSAVADKACATMELHSNGRESTRVRDLVDLVIYLTTETIDGTALTAQLIRQSKIRHLKNFDALAIPESWHGISSRSFEKSANEANLPERFCKINEAEQFVKSCIDPAIAGQIDNMDWDCDLHTWVKRN